jgi:putative flippase GtrA
MKGLFIMDLLQKKLKEHKDLIQLMKFGVVGVSNTLIDFLVFSLLVYVFTVKPNLSQAISYTAGTINSFIFNKKWTFKTEEKKDVKLQGLRFLIINALSLILSSVSISYLIDDLYINKIIAKILIVLLTQVINYLGYKLIVFK